MSAHEPQAQVYLGSDQSIARLFAAWSAVPAQQEFERGSEANSAQCGPGQLASVRVSDEVTHSQPEDAAQTSLEADHEEPPAAQVLPAVSPAFQAQAPEAGVLPQDGPGAVDDVPPHSNSSQSEEGSHQPLEGRESRSSQASDASPGADAVSGVDNGQAPAFSGFRTGHDVPVVPSESSRATASRILMQADAPASPASDGSASPQLATPGQPTRPGRRVSLGDPHTVTPMLPLVADHQSVASDIVSEAPDAGPAFMYSQGDSQSQGGDSINLRAGDTAGATPGTEGPFSPQISRFSARARQRRRKSVSFAAPVLPSTLPAPGALGAADEPVPAPHTPGPGEADSSATLAESAATPNPSKRARTRKFVTPRPLPRATAPLSATPNPHRTTPGSQAGSSRKRQRVERYLAPALTAPLVSLARQPTVVVGGGGEGGARVRSLVAQGKIVLAPSAERTESSQVAMRLEFLWSIDAASAAWVAFGADGALAVAKPNTRLPDTLRGPDHARATLLEWGAVPAGVSPAWVANHYRWIIWKLASYERCGSRLQGAQLSGSLRHGADGRVQVAPAGSDTVLLDWDTVLQQLWHRYEREYTQGSRSALRRVLEKDESPARYMVLVVAQVVSTSSSGSGSAGAAASESIRLEVSDGWYSVECAVDDLLAEQVRRGKIFPGLKLAVCGAELYSRGTVLLDPADTPSWTPVSGLRPMDDGMDPLETVCNAVYLGWDWTQTASDRMCALSSASASPRQAKATRHWRFPLSPGLMRGRGMVAPQKLGSAVLLLRFNGTRRAVWHKRLGHQHARTFTVQLRSLRQGGGSAPQLSLAVQRVSGCKVLLPASVLAGSDDGSGHRPDQAEGDKPRVVAVSSAVAAAVHRLEQDKARERASALVQQLQVEFARERDNVQVQLARARQSGCVPAQSLESLQADQADRMSAAIQDMSSDPSSSGKPFATMVLHEAPPEWPAFPETKSLDAPLAFTPPSYRDMPVEEPTQREETPETAQQQLRAGASQTQAFLPASTTETSLRARESPVMSRFVAQAGAEGGEGGGGSTGFVTGRNKPLVVSESAKARAASVLGEGSEGGGGSTGFVTGRSKPLVVSESAKARAASVLGEGGEGGGGSTGFVTGRNKPLVVSESAKARAASVLGEGGEGDGVSLACGQRIDAGKAADTVDTDPVPAAPRTPASVPVRRRVVRSARQSASAAIVAKVRRQRMVAVQSEECPEKFVCEGPRSPFLVMCRTQGLPCCEWRCDPLVSVPRKRAGGEKKLVSVSMWGAGEESIAGFRAGERYFVSGLSVAARKPMVPPLGLRSLPANMSSDLITQHCLYSLAAPWKSEFSFLLEVHCSLDELFEKCQARAPGPCHLAILQPEDPFSVRFVNVVGVGPQGHDEDCVHVRVLTPPMAEFSLSADRACSWVPASDSRAPKSARSAQGAAGAVLPTVFTSIAHAACGSFTSFGDSVSVFIGPRVLDTVGVVLAVSDGDERQMASGLMSHTFHIFLMDHHGAVASVEVFCSAGRWQRKIMASLLSPGTVLAVKDVQYQRYQASLGVIQMRWDDATNATSAVRRGSSFSHLASAHDALSAWCASDRGAALIALAQEAVQNMLSGSGGERIMPLWPIPLPRAT